MLRHRIALRLSAAHHERMSKSSSTTQRMMTAQCAYGHVRESGTIGFMVYIYYPLEVLTEKNQTTEKKLQADDVRKLHKTSCK
jgi:hypothetical protein